MVHYNYIEETQPNRAETGWRFRVKIFRVYPYYVFEDGPPQSFILADHRGANIDMVIYPGKVNNFSGLDKKKGKWTEISGVRVVRADPGFRPTKSRHRIEVTYICDIKTYRDDPIDTMGVVSIICPLEVDPDNPARKRKVSHLRDAHKYTVDLWPEYLKTKGPETFVGLKMWRSVRTGSEPNETWIETVEGLSDYMFNPRIKEVQDLRFQLEAADTDAAGSSDVLPI